MDNETCNCNKCLFREKPRDDLPQISDIGLTDTNITVTCDEIKRNKSSYNDRRNVTSFVSAKSQRKMKTGGKRKRRGKGFNGSLSELPPISNAPIQMRSMRYAGTISTSTDFRVADFTTILLSVVNGSTTAVKLFQAVLIKSVSVTCLPNSDANSGTFAFTWYGEREPDNVLTMFYSQGQPSRWTFTPPPESLAGFWITQNTTTTESSVFTLDPDNSTVKIILDLNFAYVLADGASGTLTISAPAYTGIAARYMPGSATDELIPVGITAISV